MMLSLGVGTDHEKAGVETTPTAMSSHVSTAEGLMPRIIAQHLVENAKNVVRITTLKPCVNVEIVTLTDVT